MRFGFGFRFMMFKATSNNISFISWWSVLLVEETGVSIENHRPAVNHWQNFITYCWIEYTSPWTGFGLTMLVVIGTNCTGSCKSTYHTVTTMMVRRKPRESNRYTIVYLKDQGVVFIGTRTRFFSLETFGAKKGYR